MCGIAGMLALRGDGREGPAFARNAVLALNHRGPDARGHWSDAASGIALGHARLSILELSPAGAQPMASPHGRFVITFNGEIYNHEALRKELESAGSAPAWRGHSDTETVLACFEAWGIGPTLTKLVGMFAMGIWDKHARTISLVRDRLGEKPLYYGRCGDDLVFGSELKAMRIHPRFPRAVSRDALSLLLRFNYIPAPYSIHPGIKKLPQGTMVTFSTENPDAVPTQYWSVQSVAAARASAAARPLSDGEAVDQFDGLLRQSVRGQMLSDVPLGAFLSGGYDSSMIVALMQSMSSSPVRTFTLGFHASDFNEAAQASAIAKHLGTDHTEMYLSPAEARDIIPSLPRIYDEPFADSSQIPTVLVSRLARQRVTVALTGDGADELLGGYGRYALGRSMWQRLFLLPHTVRQTLALAIGAAKATKLTHAALRAPLAHERLDNLVSILNAATADEIGMQQSCQWKHPEDVVLGGQKTLALADEAPEWLIENDQAARLMMIDLVSYLPGDILTKVDRAAMSVSLETRVPFLDHRVVEFAMGLPMHMKIRDGRGKWILRELLGRYLPPALTERPKMGFAVPVGTWLRGPLRDWAEALLSEERLRRDGYLHPKPIRQKWEEHLSGKGNWHLHLWSVLMFQAWLDSNSSQQELPALRVS